MSKLAIAHIEAARSELRSPVGVVDDAIHAARGEDSVLRRRLHRALRLAWVIERSYVRCHCGRITRANGVNYGDVCMPCMRVWHAAGEPQYCPCG